jgi:hypothetical protein
VSGVEEQQRRGLDPDRDLAAAEDLGDAAVDLDRAAVLDGSPI